MQIITDPTYGYKRIDPLPGEDEINEFYRESYYKTTKSEQLQRLMVKNHNRDAELHWLQHTLYADIVYLLHRYIQPPSVKKVLDVGCGNGYLMEYLQHNGFSPQGIEPDINRQTEARARKLKVWGGTLQAHVENVHAAYHIPHIGSFDAVTMINLLEHVPNPAQILEMTKSVLKTDGVLCLCVPNDFNALQLIAQDYLDKNPWWVAPYEHLNYFDFQSLRVLLELVGYQVEYLQGDFPMEVFLFMKGKDYTDNREKGFQNHQQRMAFELALPPHIRRKLYQALGERGIGRSCLMLARLK